MWLELRQRLHSLRRLPLVKNRSRQAGGIQTQFLVHNCFNRHAQLKRRIPQARGILGVEKVASAPDVVVFAH
jgi:hypothetical protein